MSGSQGLSAQGQILLDPKAQVCSIKAKAVGILLNQNPMVDIIYFHSKRHEAVI